MLRLSKHDINSQLVPPAVHGVNPAESALRIQKPFIAILSTEDLNFTLVEWDRLLQHSSL